MSQIILNKPSDVYKFGYEYFKSKIEPENNVLIVCGPSGVGKGTLLKSLFSAYEDKFSLSVSHTTRAPRDGEIDGKSYFFVTKEKFQGLITQNNYFIEYAEVHENFYGTSFKGIKEITQVQKKVCVLEIDIQGVQKVCSELKIRPKILYIAPPSVEILKERLHKRGSEEFDHVELRIKNAVEEIEWCETPGNVDKKIVNDELGKALEEIVETVEEWFPQIRD